MARQPRFLLAGLPHLVHQRGHNGAPIVLDDDDRRHWLGLLRDAAVTHRVGLHAWSISADHFRLLATPATPQALSRMMQALGRRYVGWFNVRHQRSGTLWDGRFRACVVEPGPAVLRAMCHVECDPAVVARESHDPLAASLEPAARWSSLAHHLGRQVDPGLQDVTAYWALGNTPFERQAAFRRLTEAGLSPRESAAVDTALRGGAPLGSPDFVASLQPLTPRPLSPRRRGRPRKSELLSAR